MRLLKLAFRRETAMPMLALTFASAVSVTLVFARIVWTGHLRYAFLVWNLFLAWLPLIFALLAREKYQHTSGRNWRFAALAGRSEERRVGKERRWRWERDRCR